MSRDRGTILPRGASPDPIEWLPGSLGAVFPRVESQFCGQAAVRKKVRADQVRRNKIKRHMADLARRNCGRRYG